MEWDVWTTQQIAEALRQLAQLVESKHHEFSEEYREKNQEVAASFLANTPTADNLARSADGLTSLGFAIVGIARLADSHRERLELLHAAHELSRAGRTLQAPSSLMRQAVNEAIKAVVNHEVERAIRGETDAQTIHTELRKLVNSAWDSVPAQTALLINEQLFEKVNGALVERAGDAEFERRFVRDNVEAILTMELPSRLEKTRDRWVEVARHVAPTALSVAITATSPPQELSKILASTLLDLNRALETASTEILKSSLESCEDALVENLRLRLDVEAQAVKPISELRNRGQPDRLFLEAKQLLERGNPVAKQKFEDLHYNRPTDTIAKEWYAYAIKRFGTTGDRFDVIELLTDARRSQYFRIEFGWPALWNLACELRNVATREHEALDVLLPVLESDQHDSSVFKLCLLWALDDEREDVLRRLLKRSLFFEAQLLATVYGIRSGSQSEEDRTDDFRRVNRILRKPDQDFPLPHEKLNLDELDRLTREFIGNSMILAGVEWFQQRIAIGGERYSFKNWQCLARLYEETGNKAAAWRCKAQEWDRTVKQKNAPNSRKRVALTALLRWAQQENFQREAMRLLRKDARAVEIDPNEILLWEKKLAVQHEPEKLPDENGKEKTQKRTKTPEEADAAIRELAPAWSKVTSVDQLADRAQDALHLLEASLVRNPVAPARPVAALREVIRLAGVFRAGVDVQQAQSVSLQMREQLGPLSEDRESMPYELSGLMQAAERAIQSLVVRVKAVSELNVAQPSQMQTSLPVPGASGRVISRVFTRISNPGMEEACDVQVEIIPSSSYVVALENPVYLHRLGPDESEVVEFPVEILAGIENEVELRVQARCTMGRVPSGGKASGHVVVQEFSCPIPALDRYTTDQPVPVDRPDLFHGRSRELRELSDAFAGGRLLRLNFINGIRAVGKSSLVNHLGLHTGPDILPLLVNVETVLSAPRMDSVQLVRGMIREAIRGVTHIPEFPPGLLSPPDAEAFKLDPPMVVLDSFLEDMRQRSGRQSILLAVDEMQALVKRVADPDDPMDDGFLSWLRDKIQTRSNILVVCTGSEPYELMRKRYEHGHNVWRNIKPYDVSFVDRQAMVNIATIPVQPDGVFWLPEALDRLWDTTEGHPWIIQQVAMEVMGALNAELRRVVGPGDIDRAASVVVTRSEVVELWWNEKEGLVNNTHKQIAYLILQNQGAGRQGIAESELIASCKRSGIATSARYIEEMKALEVLSRADHGAEIHWRIRSAFLERHLAQMMQRELSETGATLATHLPNRPLALMLDWENIKISLMEVLKKMPREKADTVRDRLNGGVLGAHLLKLAECYGDPRQRWVVADWDRPLFAGEQKALRGAGFWTEMAGTDKKNASDHVLIEKIHYVLREHPDVMVYVLGTGDGDYGSVVSTLRESGKDVILWVPHEEAMSKAYKHFLSGPDRIRIELLDNLVLGDEAPVPSNSN